jgi:hypothetical protein
MESWMVKINYNNREGKINKFKAAPGVRDPMG